MAARSQANKDILALAKSFQDAKKRLSRKMGSTAVNFFKKSFKDGGFTDSTLEKWKEPQRREKAEGKKRFKYSGYTRSDRRRAILVKSGALRRSIRYIVIMGGRVQVISDLPYSQRHNEGTHGMPQRRFIGASEKLNDQLEDLIRKEVLTSVVKNHYKKK